MKTIELSNEELELIVQKRKKDAVNILMEGIYNKKLLIKTDKNGAHAMGIHIKDIQYVRRVLSQEHFDAMIEYHDKYANIYRLEKGSAKITNEELEYIKQVRCEKLFTEMSSGKLPVVFKLTGRGIVIEIRDKSKSARIVLDMNNLQKFEEFLLK